MTLNESEPMFIELSKLEGGSYHIVKKLSFWQKLFGNGSEGWLHVDHEENGTVSIMFTSHQHTHSTGWGSALSISFDYEGRLLYYHKSALSMWIRWARNGSYGEECLGEALEFAQWVHQKLVKETACVHRQ